MSEHPEDIVSDGPFMLSPIRIADLKNHHVVYFKNKLCQIMAEPKRVGLTMLLVEVLPVGRDSTSFTWNLWGTDDDLVLILHNYNI